MDQDRKGAEATRLSPTLLVSIHDVSPLTLEDCRHALDLAASAGLPPRALTLLVIPCHDDRAPLDENATTCDWLRALEAQGAHLVMHGYTHRMEGRSLSPRGIFWAHGFARGQAEFFRTNARETRERIGKGKAILRRAGLESATTDFVPPAWLLSAEARDVVQEQGFAWHEEIGGIVTDKGLRAQRLVGWGSLNAVEACATRFWAALQVRRTMADTRLAIHPADMRRPRTVASIRATLRTLMARSTPSNYQEFLRRPPTVGLGHPDQRDRPPG